MDLVPYLVDRRANATFTAIYAEYPVSTLSYHQGYCKITYRDLANAVNNITRWLRDGLGSGYDHECLAYIGPNDLRCPTLNIRCSQSWIY